MSKDYTDSQLIELEALEAILRRTPEYLERRIRRWYSKTFSTPLEHVYDLSWSWVLLQYYESQLEKMPYNELLDLAMDSYLPEITTQKELEDQAFADKIAAQEIEKQKKREAKKKEARIKKENEELKEQLAQEALEDEETLKNNEKILKQQLNSLASLDGDPIEEKDSEEEEQEKDEIPDIKMTFDNIDDGNDFE